MDHRTASRSFRIAVSTLAIGAAVVALTGCSAVLNAAHRVHEESFDARAAAAKGWVGVDLPAWIPGDATELHNLATDDETNSVIHVATSSDPTGCTEGDGSGLPFQPTDWAPALDSAPTTVQLCGDYQVVKQGDGLTGWFTAAESGQTPTG